MVWWCQLWKCFIQAPRAPDTIFSANVDVVDNRGKGPELSTLSSKCTHDYFLSTLLLFPSMKYRPVWLIWVSGFLTMSKGWGFVYWAWRVQVLWKMAKYEHRCAAGFTQCSLWSLSLQHILHWQYVRFAANHSYRINFSQSVNQSDWNVFHTAHFPYCALSPATNGFLQ